MDDVELAWFTGLFEGEGTIVNEGKHGVHIKIQMTDSDVIQRVFRLVNCGSVIESNADKRKSYYKPAFMWRVCNGLDVKRLLLLMLPLLGDRRRARALEALARLENNWSVRNNSTRRMKIKSVSA